MQDFEKNQAEGSKGISNMNLAKEALETIDPERQSQLAQHPSALVRWSLARNEHLAEEAIKLLGGAAELETLRARTQEAILDLEK